MRVDPVTKQQTVIFGNLPSPMDVEFAPDGSYYLATFRGNQIVHYSASNVLLQSYPTEAISDQLVYNVPEPGAVSLAALAATVAWLRRRHTRP